MNITEPSILNVYNYFVRSSETLNTLEKRLIPLPDIAIALDCLAIAIYLRNIVRKNVYRNKHRVKSAHAYRITVRDFETAQVKVGFKTELKSIAQAVPTANLHCFLNFVIEFFAETTCSAPNGKQVTHTKAFFNSLVLVAKLAYIADLRKCLNDFIRVRRLRILVITLDSGPFFCGRRPRNKAQNNKGCQQETFRVQLHRCLAFF